MAFFRGKVVWSPVELDYLKEKRSTESINQLSLALAKSRHAVKVKLDEFDGKASTKKMSKRSVIGKRKDLGQFFRSNWEANMARWFNYQGISWAYEPEVFVFKGIRKGTISYCPDFKIDDGWVEVKGMLEPKGKTAIKRFKKHFPEEFKKLKAVVGRRGTDADKFFASIGVPILAYINELDKEFKKVIAYWE
jgi:hypothetical protein